MASELIHLLKKATAQSKYQTDKRKVSCIIRSDKSVDLIISCARKLKPLCHHFVIELLKEQGDKEKNEILSALDYFPVNFVHIGDDNNRERFDLKALKNLSNSALYDRIIVTRTNYSVNTYFYTQLLSANTDIVSAIGTKGNVLTDIFYYDKWKIKRLMQLLEFNSKSRIEDLFRLSVNMTLLKIGKGSFIRFEDKTMSKNSKTYSQDYLNYIFKYLFRNIHVSQDNIIKTIALFHTLRDKNKESNGHFSKYKIEQLLRLLTFFEQNRLWFFAYQIAYFLITSPNAEVMLPQGWSLERIKKLAQKLLINESKDFAVERVERLRYYALKDLLEMSLISEYEREWISKELAIIKVNLSKDNLKQEL